MNRHYAERGELAWRVKGWWHDAGKQEPLAEIGALIEGPGSNKARVIEGLSGCRCAASRTSAAGSSSSGARALLPKPTRQTNVSFSRQGVIRGLHYHERGQDDLFVCLQGTARVVVLDRETGETFTEDIGDDNPVAMYVPGHHAHGFEALTDLLFCYHVTEEYDPADPDEHGIPWDDPRVRHLWSTDRRSSPRGTPTRPDHRRGRPARPRARPRRSRATTSSRSRARTGT